MCQIVEPIIIWEKWIDPLGTVEELSDIEDETYEYENQELHNKKINAIVTPMGLIPINEHTDCTKVFNFWTGHTNFSISKNIADTISEIDGVETLDIFTRYRFRVAFGKAFVDRDIINSINNKIYTYIKEND